MCTFRADRGNKNAHIHDLDCVRNHLRYIPIYDINKKNFNVRID